MGSFTDYTEEKILDFLFGAVSYTPPSSLYIGLSSTAINEDGTGVSEPSGGGYARAEVANDMFTWKSVVQGDLEQSQKKNNISIEFPEATAEWGTMTHFFIADALTEGNILAYGALNEDITIVSQDKARFVEDTLVIELD